MLRTKNKTDRINELPETDPKEIANKHDLRSKSRTKI
jgi:hypothetical protein